MKKTFLFLICILNIYAIEPIALQFTGFDVTHTFLNNEKKVIKVQRDINSKCMEIAMYPENFTQEYIEKNIPNECKKQFITTKGVIQPFIIDKDIKTIGEIEVMDFIYNKSSKEPNKYALIDSRKAIWFDKETIPSALNVPYEDLKYDEDFKDDFYKAYANLGIKVKDKNKFDFSNAKTVIFFCNGSWCPISTKSIEYLTKIGFPKEKILWFRGGLESWKGLSLTTVKN